MTATLPIDPEICIFLYKQILYDGHDMPVTVGTKKEHKPKNRFTNIIPCMNEVNWYLLDIVF